MLDSVHLLILTLTGDKALELVAILNAGLLQLATDADWNADGFQIHLDNVKGIRPLPSEMILAVAYQHLYNMSFDSAEITCWDARPRLDRNVYNDSKGMLAPFAHPLTRRSSIRSDPRVY